MNLLQQKRPISMHTSSVTVPHASHARIDFAPGTITQEWNVSIVEGTNSFEADVDYPMDREWEPC